MLQFLPVTVLVSSCTYIVRFSRMFYSYFLLIYFLLLKTILKKKTQTQRGDLFIHRNNCIITLRHFTRYRIIVQIFRYRQYRWCYFGLFQIHIQSKFISSKTCRKLAETYKALIVMQQIIITWNKCGQKLFHLVFYYYMQNCSEEILLHRLFCYFIWNVHVAWIVECRHFNDLSSV